MIGLLVLLLFLPGATLARADTPPPLPAASIVKPQQLRAEVRAVLDGPAYRWRLPAEETRAASSWLAGTAFWRFSERCAEWARNHQ